MIAQILARGRRSLAVASRSPAPSDSNDSRTVDLGTRCVHVGLAILLLPALATVLVVGGLGAAAVGLVTVVTRAVNDVEEPSSS